MKNQHLANEYLSKIAHFIIRGNDKAVNWYTEQYENEFGPMSFGAMTKVIKLLTQEVKGLKKQLNTTT